MKTQFFSSLLFLSVSLSLTSAFGQGFTSVELDAGIFFLVDHQTYMGGGSAFFDFDQDGHLDVYLTGGDDRDRLYRNNGSGNFTEVSIAAGLMGTADVFTHGVAVGDIDNDGFKDIFLSTWDLTTSPELTHNLLYYNNGDGTFSDISASAGITNDSTWSSSTTFGDYNQDGFLDIYTVGYVKKTMFDFDPLTGMVVGFNHQGHPNQLYINNGDLTFTEMADSYGMQDLGCGLAVASTDYDSDGDIDVLVANDFGEWVEPDRLFQNQYPSPFMVELGAAAGADNEIYGMGIAIGDYDQDGDLDYYYTNLGRNVLLQNQGDGTFIDVTSLADVENADYEVEPGLFRLVTSWGTAFFDYDQDTKLDLFVCNGFVPSAEFIATTSFDPNKMYHNQGDGTFVDEAQSLGVDDANVGRGFSIGDYDDDGDMDMVIVNVNEFITDQARVKLYRNDIDGQANWFKVYLEGVQSNRDAYGALVTLYAGGQSFIREIDGGSSHASAHESVAHFGLADLPYVDSIQVRWPNGLTESYCGYDVNQKVEFLEGSGQSSCSVTSIDETTTMNTFARLFPNPSDGALNIEVLLTESSDLRIELFDSQGKKISTWTERSPSAGRQIIPLDVPHLPTGIYQIRLTQNDRSFNLRWLRS